jgi:PAS domain S-box-containing protein
MRTPNTRDSELFELMSDAVVVHRDGNIIFVNTAAAVLHGAATAVQLLGKNYFDLIHPDEHGRVFSRRKKTLTGKVLEPLVRKGRRLDGSELMVEARGSQLIWDGGPATLLVLRDITERKRAEKALRESEARYRRLVELSPDGIMVHIDGVIVFANASLATIIGAGSPDELIGTLAIDLVVPEQREEVLERRRTVSAGKSVDLVEARYLRLDGSETYVERVLSIITWHEKPAYLVIVRDTNKRKQAESALRESEEKYRDLIEGSLLANLIISDNGERLYVNQAFLDLFGYETADEFLSLEHAGALAAPYERERLIKFRDAVLAGEQALGPYEFDAMRKDGSIIPVQAIPRRLVWEGQHSLQRTYIDLTERKRTEEALRHSEERYRKLVDLSTDAIYVHKMGRIVLINPAGVKVFGAASPDQVIGMSPLELVHPDDRHDVAERMKSTAREGTITAFQEQRRFRIDGTEFWAEVAAVAMEWEGERGAIVVVRDITSQKEAAAIMSEAKNAADLANRAKSEFLANMSHELRTPLNAIIGFSDMIRSQALGPVGSPKYLEYGKDINSSGMHLLELINDILDLSKIEAGKHELHEQEIDVHRVLRSCFTLVKERAAIQGVKIESNVEEDAPPLFADERNLKQIFLNLMTNAIKFTPAGGTVSVSIWSNRDEGYVFQFADTGIGIAPDDIPKALASFGQVESELAVAHQGTGLGLPLTKSLVELHGGSFDLESKVGSATIVTVRFPAERVVSELATGT